MPARFELIVFDWDGTLIDSAAAIVHAIQAACRDLDIEPPSAHAARQVIGLGLHDALGAALPGVPASAYGELAQRYRFHYLSRDHELTLFPGVRELLEELVARGRVLAIATGKSRAGLDRALGWSGLGHLFSASRCADETFSKPHPRMLHELIDALDAAPGRTLMVGDTTHDLQMAVNAGVASLAVSYGAHAREQLTALASHGCAADTLELRQCLRDLA